MTAVDLDYVPQLRDPVAVVAFAGWNDAAGAATGAARFISTRLGARRFGVLPAEEFFDFKAARPTVKIRPSGERDLTWPSVEFYAARNIGGPHDLVIAVGTEPGLRWNTFTGAVTRLFEDLGVGLTITLGALLADSPHTRPVRVTGSAPDPATAERLGLEMSRYEGPTGIVGVLNDSLRRAGLAAASLWANCPHYVSTSQNPPATAALVTRLGLLVDVRFDVAELERAGERFVREVNTAVAANPEVAAYVRRLESAMDAAKEAQPELPAAGPELFRDIERFLREGGQGGD